MRHAMKLFRYSSKTFSPCLLKYLGERAVFCTIHCSELEKILFAYIEFSIGCEMLGLY